MPAAASSRRRCDELGSCQPVMRPSTACRPPSGVTTRFVRPAPAWTAPSAGDRLERAHDGGPHRDHPAAPFVHGVHEPRGGRRHAVALGIRALAELERRHAGVQRERREQHAARRQLCHQLAGERPRRARHLGAAGVDREDRLVGVDRPLPWRVAIADRMPVAAQVVVDRLTEREAREGEAAAAEVGREQLCLRAARKLEPGAVSGSLGRQELGAAQLHDPVGCSCAVAGPARRREVQQQVLAVQPCRQRRGQRGRGVHHEQVAGPQEAPDLAEAGMHQAAVRAGCHEQPHVGAVGSADLRRLLGFERLGVARVDHRSAPMTSLAR